MNQKEKLLYKKILLLHILLLFEILFLTVGHKITGNLPKELERELPSVEDIQKRIKK